MAQVTLGCRESYDRGGGSDLELLDGIVAHRGGGGLQSCSVAVQASTWVFALLYSYSNCNQLFALKATHVRARNDCDTDHRMGVARVHGRL